MMIEQARVLAYQNGIATVQCFAKSSCGGCGSRNSCGIKSLSALAGEKQAPQFELKVDQRLETGDLIELGITEACLLFSVFWLYGLPLLVILASSLFFSQWIANELLVAMLIVFSTVTTFFIIKKILSRKLQQGVMPKFLRKV